MLDGKGKCWCRPETEIINNTLLVKHNSMDNREAYEEGKLKLHQGVTMPKGMKTGSKGYKKDKKESPRKKMAMKSKKAKKKGY